MKHIDKLDGEFLLEQGIKLAGNKITCEQYLNSIDNLIGKLLGKQANGVEQSTSDCNKPHVSNSEASFCDCGWNQSTFQLDTGEICCCNCEKPIAK